MVWAYIILILIGIVISFYYYIIRNIEGSKRRSLEDVYKDKELCVTYNIGNKRTPKDYGLEYEEVSFASRDKLLLKGWYIKGGKGAIVLCHGRSGNRLSVMQHLELLSKDELLKDYSILLYDMRNGGLSTKANTGIGQYFRRDIAGAIDYMISKGHKNFYLWGFSMGSMALLKAVDDYKLEINIEGFILDSPMVNGSQTIEYSFKKEGYNNLIQMLSSIFYNIHLKNKISDYTFRNLLPNIRERILILQSKEDIITPYRIFREELEKVPNKSNLNLSIELFDKGEHLAIRSIYRESYDILIRDFILGGRSGKDK